MKRKSLQFKLQEIAKVGTLRTYSRNEALKFYREGYREDPEFVEEMVVKVRDAYDRGLILCSFFTYEKSDIGDLQVHQLTQSLAFFVINVVYFLINS